MKQLSSQEYQDLFLSHVETFLADRIKNLSVLDVVVSVSGGVDSMTLLYVAHRLYCQKKIRSVRAIYFHHQTRPGQDQESRLVKEMCDQWNIPFEQINLVGLRDLSNFEFEARLKRKAALKLIKNKNEVIWQGHHLDDSFEWSLMQRFKSSNFASHKGIPFRSRDIHRPFLCVTKKQITKFAKFSHLKWMEDPTNLDIDIERNYLRHHLIPVIEKRYPKYLKHYAQSSQAELEKRPLTSLRLFEDGFALELNELNYDGVIPYMQKISSQKRGKWSKTFFKMKKAIGEGKVGPFDFSGGVKAYVIGAHIIFYTFELRELDHFIVSYLERHSVLPKKTKHTSVKCLFDLMISEDRQLLKKQIHAFPRLSAWCQERNFSFDFCINYH